MGLDMYLEAERYVCGWEFSGDDEKARYKAILEESRLGELASETSPDATVSVTCAYWRKANAIHQWFVDNVQDGRDECQRSYVDPDKLRELCDLAGKALDAYKSGDRVRAGELLPPQAGFFFGSTEVDEWYEADLVETIHQLDRVLALIEKDPVDIYYRASW